MSTVARTLDPSWPNTVPGWFRSAAASIEGHRGRLRGDPALLTASADTWRAQADALDGVWQASRAQHRTLREGWEGDAAAVADRRVMRFVSETATSATSLRYAASGLQLAAAELASRAAQADSVIGRYVDTLWSLYNWAQSVPPPYRREAIERAISEGKAAGQQALQQVYAHTAAYDHVLSTITDRFQSDEHASWREGIGSVVQRAYQGISGGSTTLSSVRYSREDGIDVAVHPDGTATVTLNDEFRLGFYGSHGAKLSFDDLPSGAKAALTRHYAKAELAGVAGYSLSYDFDNESEAAAFIDRLAGRNPLERVLRSGQSLVGNLVGPVAEFGPWYRELTGRDPDRTTFTTGGMTKGSADAGVFPLASVAVSGGARSTVSFTQLSDGGHEVREELATTYRAGATVIGKTWQAGSGVVVSEGMSSRGPDTIVVTYDPEGNPVRLRTESSSIRDLSVEGGTNDTYVGIRNVPGLGNQLPKGAHVKGIEESLVQQVDSYSLDLTDPGALAAYEAARTERLAGLSDGSAADELDRLVKERGVLTREEYEVTNYDWAAAADVGILGNAWGIKAYRAGVEQRLIDAGYADPTQSPDLPSGSEDALRPLPLDPNTIGGGLLDVVPEDTSHQHAG